MLKKTVFTLLCLLFVGAGGRSFFANEFDGYLRIGLEQYFLERSQINLYSQELEVGVFYRGHFHVANRLTTNTHFTVRPATMPLMQMPLVLWSFEEAQIVSASFPGSFPALMDDGSWSLFALNELSGASPAAVSNQRIIIFTNDMPVFAFEGSVQFRDTSGITNLGVRQYRGVIELARFRGENITAVNIVHMDEYLLSVVPSEMPALWHMEALRAQAVAARTFTLHRMAQWAGRDYDLCDTVMSQVYSGIGREHERSSQAVHDTAGLIMTHNGIPILAAYSSCAGGVTANSEDVWVASLPFLRAVQEIYPATAQLWQRTLTHSQINQLLQNNPNVNIGNVVSVEIVTNVDGRVMQFIIHGQHGQHTLQGESIRTFFNAAPGGGLRSRNFALVDAMYVPQNPGNTPPLPPPPTTTPQTEAYILAASGFLRTYPVGLAVLSANSLTSVTDGQTVISASGLSVLSNTVAEMPYTPLQTHPARMMTSNYYIHLSGSGWGHGVGMSQHGARAMAEMGHDFRQILHFYYTGIEIVMMH